MDPLKYIFEIPHVIGKIFKWQLIISAYDIRHKIRKSVKGGAIADHLGENPLMEGQEENLVFPDEDICATKILRIQSWDMFFDLSVNMCRSGVGEVLVSPQGDQYPLAIKLEFPYTNNMEEYESCIYGIRMATEMKVQNLNVFGDSALIIHQVTGEWKTKYVKLVPYQQYLTYIIDQFSEIHFHNLPRDKNLFADALVTLAAMFMLDCGIQVQLVHIETSNFQDHCSNIQTDDPPWYHDIKEFMERREYPFEATENEKNMIRKRSVNFFLNEGILYKISFYRSLLRFLNEEEAMQLLE